MTNKGRYTPGTSWRAKWIVSLVNGQIRIHSRDGLDLTYNDQRTVIMLLSDHFRSEILANGPRAMRRPNADEEVQSKTGVVHMLDPIVQFFTAYRVKRKLSLVSVAKRMGLSTGQRVGAVEAGRVRPYIEFLRDWGYALNFNLMPIPVGMSKDVRDMVNTFLEEKYEQDMLAWSEYEPVFLGRKGSGANVLTGAELLGDGIDLGSATPGQAEGGDLPDSGSTGGDLDSPHLGEPSSSMDVEG